MPAVFGATPPRGNYADLKTKGWEMTLSWNDKFHIASKLFSYDIRFTLADNTATVTKFNNPNKRLNDYYEGMKLGKIWGYTTEGFFASADDIAKHANQKLFLSTSSGQTFPGDTKLKDLNGDNIVNPGTRTLSNPGDRSIIGNSLPRYTYGINLGAEWNNIFFSAFLQGVAKQDWWPSTEAGVFWGVSITGPTINYPDGTSTTTGLLIIPMLTCPGMYPDLPTAMVVSFGNRKQGIYRKFHI